MKINSKTSAKLRKLAKYLSSVKKYDHTHFQQCTVAYGNELADTNCYSTGKFADAFGIPNADAIHISNGKFNRLGVGLPDYSDKTVTKTKAREVLNLLANKYEQQGN